ncbi:hypothetical protein O1611_g7076 [Lasiodiplodia mahajangana]|uniref:Uncharacterized protein n=1 Tax=Lasiodiplodia mahajangana TaxID=1108764 RepID=A0ACC2JGC0_9PEZI|nr:hypothetical protein O1611_g7076 [Lasiodiplodia mahajangana]
MADSQPSPAEQTLPDSQPSEQAQNTVDEQKPSAETTTQAEKEPHTEAQKEPVKSQANGTTTSGPKRWDEPPSGRVQVGETGDLRELAARRHSRYQ